MIEELGSYDIPYVTDVLTDLLKHPDPRIRASAAEVLYQVNEAEAAERIVALLDDSDLNVRRHACGLLADCGDERFTPQLVRVLRNDPEGMVRQMAAYALGEHGDLSALPALRHAVEFDNGEDYEGRGVSETAAAAIESILARHGSGDHRDVEAAGES